MEKKMVLGVFAAMAVILISGFIIAQSDDPDLAPFDANVSISDDPYFVFAIVNVSDDYPGGFTDDFVVSPTEDANSNAYVTFILEDPNVDTDIPTSLTAGEHINITLEAPTSTSTAVASGACTHDASCEHCTNPGLQREFTCTAAISYGYEPGTWSINVSLGADGENTTETFTYLSILGVTADSGAVNWAGVQTTVANLTAASPLSVRNTGNTEVNSLNITGLDLHGETNDTQYLPIQAFSASSTNTPALEECNFGGPNTAALINDTAVAVPGFTLNYVDQGSDTTSSYFCIHTRLDSFSLPVSAQDYGAIWDVTYTP